MAKVKIDTLASSGGMDVEGEVASVTRPSGWSTTASQAVDR